MLASLFRRDDGKKFGVALLLLSVMLVMGLFLVGDAANVEAQRYSAYSDPEKPIVSYILSEEQNIAEFQDKFALSDAQLNAVLSVIRTENEVLSRVYGESQRIVEANRSLPKEQIGAKIRASGYSQSVRRAVARTKSSVERLLPANRRAEFRMWVNDKWVQERQEFNEEPAATYQAQATSSGMWFKVFATQYWGYTSYEVALPHRKLKFSGGYYVRTYLNGYSAWVPVREVGPWNTYDNYWDPLWLRTMWKDLPRGRPEAQAAYYNNYYGGRDEFGRKVLNPAGIDLTPNAAGRLGLKRYQNAWIYVYMPWVPR